MQSVAKIDIDPTEMELSGSWGSRPLGKLASTMELWRSDSGALSIEWDIPSIETTTHIGLRFEDGALVDYDGVFALPWEAVCFLREQGYTVGDEFV